MLHDTTVECKLKKSWLSYVMEVAFACLVSIFPQVKMIRKEMSVVKIGLKNEHLK